MAAFPRGSLELLLRVTAKHPEFALRRHCCVHTKVWTTSGQYDARANNGGLMKTYYCTRKDCRCGLEVEFRTIDGYRVAFHKV